MEKQMQANPVSYFLILLASLSACTTKVSEDARTEDSTEIIHDALVKQDGSDTESAVDTSPSEEMSNEENTLNDFLTGNFALSWDHEEEVGPGKFDYYYLESGVDAGETVLFFNANHEVFGNATGFDMDSHSFKGEYKIDSEKKDPSESVYKIILSGERVDYVEGEATFQRSQIDNEELQLFFKDGKVFFPVFQCWRGVKNIL